MRLFIIDNGLRDSEGHHLNNCLGLKNAADQRGIPSCFLVHANAQRSVLDALPAIPCIGHSPYELRSGDPLCGMIESYFWQSTDTAKEIAGVLEPRAGASDLVLLPSATLHELGAFALLTEKVPKLRALNVAFNFVVQDFLREGTTALNFRASLYRFAANRLRRASDARRILLTANGKELARTLGLILNGTVHRYPIPKQYPDALTVAPAAGRARRRIGVMGHMRDASKGFQLIDDLAQKFPGVDWTVQEPPASGALLWESTLAALRTCGNVTLIPGGLGSTDYYRHFSEVDIVLTPYEAGPDRLQSSGIIAEAAAAGKVVVAPANAWITEHLSRGEFAGCVFRAQNVNEIGGAIRTALADFDALAGSAAALASEWRSRQSADAYLSSVIEHFS